VRVVVDLGCIPRNGAASLPTLAWEYDPDTLYGFDAGDDLVEGTTFRKGGVQVHLRRAAAWVEDGTVLFHEDGSGSRIGAYGVEVPSIDFSKWLRALKRKTKADEIIVKMDIEGAEVQILRKMIADGTDKLMTELLVEWHSAGDEGLEEFVRCPVRRWWL
jgi:FkbM family methyltransferase